MIVYVTGAPATGKSTLCERLAELPRVQHFAYSERLRDHVTNARRPRSARPTSGKGFEPALEHVEEFEESVQEGWQIMENYGGSREASQERRRAVIWYLRGLGTIEGLERAISAGDRDSALNLSLMYVTGNHVPKKDTQRAYEWMQKAAEMGNVKAGLLLKSVQPDSQVSLAELQPTMDLCDRAAEGDEASRYEIGRRYLEGINVDPDPTAAALWLLISYKYPPSRAALELVPREQWPEEFRDEVLPTVV